jgi:hypothetical protein
MRLGAVAARQTGVRPGESAKALKVGPAKRDLGLPPVADRLLWEAPPVARYAAVAP